MHQKANGQIVEYKRPEKIDLTKIQLSHYQERILDMALNSDDNLIVNATAGSGKSFILKAIAQKLPVNLRVMYATFDKRSVQDIGGQLPSGVEASTWHSYGYRQVRRHFSSGGLVEEVVVNNKKNSEIFKELREDEPLASKKILSDNYAEILGLVSFVKNVLGEYEFHRIGQGVLFTEQDNYCIGFAQKILTESIMRADAGEIDFDDMIFLPASGRVGVQREHDLVLCDEAQDLNPAQIELVKKACNRTIIVGDRNQAIYLFRGADSLSMDLLQSHFNATPMPLSITYRNPISHVNYVNQQFPWISHEVNPSNTEQGFLGAFSQDRFTDAVQPNDMAICRFNAPLVPLALSLIADGKTAYVAGRDIGKGLIKMLKSSTRFLKAEDMKSVITAIHEYTQKKVQKFEEAGNSTTGLIDQRDTLIAVALSDGITNRFELENRITALFDDDRPGVKLSTVHRAKGSEAENVYIIDRQAMPFGKGDPTEERNVLFVALTRSKKNMGFVKVEK